MFTIYTPSEYTCQWCVKAKGLLETAGLPFDYVQLDAIELFEQSEKASMVTVPIIYKGDTLIGGHDALVEHLNDR